MAIATLSIDLVAKLANLERDMGKAANIAERNSARIKKAFSGLDKLLSGIAVGAFIRSVVAATTEQERVVKQLEQTIKSTGGAAGLTRDELLNMASGLQSVTTFGDEATISAQSLLLTFTSIGRDIFPEALEAVLNVSTAMGTDLKSASLQVGKALNDPVRGMNSLAESGIQFSKSQKDTIKALTETGRVADAQKIILRELETQFGGSARAARDTFGGALQALQNAFGDLLEGDAGGDGVRGAKDAVQDFTRVLESPATKAAFDSITSSIFRMLEATASAATGFANFAAQIGKSLGEIVGGPSDQLGAIGKEIGNTESKLKTLRSELEKTRLLRINPFQSTEDLRREYDETLSRLRAMRVVQKELQQGIGARATTSPQASRPSAVAVPTIGLDGGKAKAAKPSKEDPLGDFLKDVERQIKPAQDAIERFRDIQLDASVSGAELTKAERQLFDLMNSPEWQEMAEPWRELVIQQFESANAADKAATEQQRLNDLLAATPTEQLERTRETMQFLADAFERGAISADQFNEAASAALGNTADKAKETLDVMDEFSKNAARGMQESLSDFLFDPFADGLEGMVKGFGKTIQRMVADAVAADLARRLFGADGGGGGWIGQAATFAASFFADGGVMTSDGTVPLRKYATGGIANSPQLAVFGDGSTPEAYVPLPDGRNIPVKMQGGGSTVINVNVASGTPSEVRRAAASGAREALGFMSNSARYA